MVELYRLVDLIFIVLNFDSLAAVFPAENCAHEAILHDLNFTPNICLEGTLSISHTI